MHLPVSSQLLFVSLILLVFIPEWIIIAGIVYIMCSTLNYHEIRETPILELAIRQRALEDVG